MKNECLNYKYVYNSNYPVSKLANKLGESKRIIYLYYNTKLSN